MNRGLKVTECLGRKLAVSTCIKSATIPVIVHCWGEGAALLHKLTHAHHHKFLQGGFDNAEVLECYERAVEKGLYEKVCVHDMHGTEECRAYACTNRMEYFAELSAAFLGGLHDDKEFSKWYPHNRSQIVESRSNILMRTTYEVLKHA